jgi:hypothetical protein
MDLMKMIQSLYRERELIERAIAGLGELRSISQDLPASLSGKRRGRKSMGAEERKQVSARMKKYWAMRRKAKK